MKTATAWKPNTAITTGILYNSPTTTYSSPLVAYSSTTATLPDQACISAVWKSPSRQASSWKINSAAVLSGYTYDGGATYDSFAPTYDAIVSGQDQSDVKTATVWRNA